MTRSHWQDNDVNEEETLMEARALHDKLVRIAARELAEQLAPHMDTAADKLMFGRWLVQSGRVTESLWEGMTLALTMDVVQSILSLVRDTPDVIPVDQLVEAGMNRQDAERLASNHSGIPLANGHVPVPSVERYAGGVFAVDPLLVDEPGVYTPDLLIHLAGKLKVAWESPWSTGGANIRFMKERLADAVAIRPNVGGY